MCAQYCTSPSDTVHLSLVRIFITNFLNHICFNFEEHAWTNERNPNRKILLSSWRYWNKWCNLMSFLFTKKLLNLERSSKLTSDFILLLFFNYILKERLQTCLNKYNTTLNYFYRVPFSKTKYNCVLNCFVPAIEVSYTQMTKTLKLSKLLIKLTFIFCSGSDQKA